MTPISTITTAAAVAGVMILLDIVAGIASAASRGDIDSTTLRQGLWHKLGSILAMALGLALEYACDVLPLDISLPLFVPIASYIVLMEACSIYENLKLLNPELHIESLEDLFRFEADGDNKKGIDSDE